MEWASSSFTGLQVYRPQDSSCRWPLILIIISPLLASEIPWRACHAPARSQYFFAASCSIMLGAKRLVAFSSPVQCASLAKRSREAAKRRLGSFIGGLCLFFSFESSPQSALEAFVFAFFTVLQAGGLPGNLLSHAFRGPGAGKSTIATLSPPVIRGVIALMDTPCFKTMKTAPSPAWLQGQAASLTALTLVQVGQVKDHREYFSKYIGILTRVTGVVKLEYF